MKTPKLALNWLSIGATVQSQAGPGSNGAMGLPWVWGSWAEVVEQSASQVP